MGRYVNSIPINNVDLNYLSNEVSKYMTSEGFAPYNYKGVNLWKKGVGMLTAPQFLQIMYYPDHVQIDAFIKYPLFPGLYVGEMGITGFFAALPKSLLSTRVRTVESYLYSILQSQASAFAQQQQQQVPQQPVQPQQPPVQ